MASANDVLVCDRFHALGTLLSCIFLCLELVTVSDNHLRSWSCLYLHQEFKFQILFAKVKLRYHELIHLFSVWLDLTRVYITRINLIIIRVKLCFLN